MTPERWQQIDALLMAALELEASERQTFLESQCGEDLDLRREVETLLRAQGKVGDFLEQPVAAPESDSFPWSAAPTGVEVGDRIDVYRIEREIGRGGMSSIFLAVRDDEYQQRVAMKVIKPGMDTEVIMRRFRTERQILANLEHPHIARQLDGGTTTAGRPYLVMEYIEGMSIDKYCAQQNLDLKARLDLFLKVGGAVQYAHRHLVVHRDLKPANILVDASGEPKLLDFGIAKLLDPESFPQTVEVTQAGLRPMTPRYASPEQIQGGKVTTATDVFALGLLLHELLVGDLPADRGGKGETSTLRGDLANIVQMALREEPERRYASVEQFMDDLQRYRSGLPVRARKDTLFYRSSRFIHRHRLGVGVVAVFGLLLASFGVSLARQVERTSSALAVAELERDKAEEVADLLYGLFEGTAPRFVEQESITARELLDRGTVQIEKLQDQPLVQATALEVLGSAYGSLGMFGKARPLLEESLRLRLEFLGEEHVDVAASWHSLGAVLTGIGELEKSREALREALRQRRKLLPSQHLQSADTMYELGLSLRTGGHFEEAEKLLLMAYDIQTEMLGEGAHETLVTAMEIGNLMTERQEFERAEEHYRRNLAIAQGSENEVQDFLRTMIVFGLATALHYQGQAEEAVELFRDTLQVLERILGKNHPLVVDNLQNLGGSLLSLGEVDESETLVRRALEIRLRDFSGGYSYIASNHSLLGYILSTKKDFKGAAEQFGRSIEIGRMMVPVHPLIAIPLHERGRVLLELGKEEEAIVDLEEAWELNRNNLPEGHFSMAEVALTLGRCLRRLGELERAEELLLSSYHAFERLEGEVEYEKQALSALVSLYEQQGKDEMASTWRTQLTAL